MRSVNIAYRCTLIAGILLMLLSIPHALGLQDVLEHSRTGAISVDYAPTIVIIWVFSSITMFLTGATLLYLSKLLQLGYKSAWRLCMLIGIGLAIFGGGFFIQYPASYHILGFLIIGLLVVVPLLVFARRFR